VRSVDTQFEQEGGSYCDYQYYFPLDPLFHPVGSE